MRVLYIITQGEQGGGQKNVLDLALGMIERGHQVYVAVGEIENLGDKWLHTEFRRDAPLEKVSDDSCVELRLLQREVVPIRDIKSVLEVTNLLKKIKPDIVHLHSSKAGVVGGLACFCNNFFAMFSKDYKKIKSVYTVHGFVFLEPMSDIKKFVYVFLEFISSLCRNFTILISQLDINAGKKFFILRSPKDFKIIYNGISKDSKKEMFTKEEARRFFVEKIPPTPYAKINSPIVGTISNLYKTKGLEYLIEAATKVVREKPNTVFVVMGFGPESYLQQLVSTVNKHKLENNFFFLGRTEKAFRYLRGLDVFTLTSVKEGLPYCLIEAKLAGVPIVASSVGEIPEMSKHMSISLVKPKDSNMISSKILQILDTNQGATKDDSLPQVYTLENMLNQTENVYKKLVD